MKITVFFARIGYLVKLKIERTPSAIFVIKTPRDDCRSASPA